MKDIAHAAQSLTESDLDRLRAQRLRRRKWRGRLYPLDRACFRALRFLASAPAAGADLVQELDGQRVLLLAPHQDDEVLGAGGLLLRCRGRTEVQPVFMTTGRGRTVLRGEAERDRLAAERQAEAALVSRSLGLSEPLTLPFDGPELADAGAVLDRLLPLFRSFRPTLVLAPFFGDGHLHHRHTTAALAQLPAAVADGLRVVLYHTHVQIPPAMVNRIVALDEERHRAKQAILALYRTQKLHEPLIRDKYSLYAGNWFPPGLRARSVERFCLLEFDAFRRLHRRVRGDHRLYRTRSIFYPAFSFPYFLRNAWVMRRSPALRAGMTEE